MADTLVPTFNITREQIAAFVKDPRTVRDIEAFLRMVREQVPSLIGTKVDDTRQIISGAGLTGGGDLTVDRTLDIGAGTGITVAADSIALADTAVSPATYGDATHVGQFTVDQQGRLTLAASVAITFPSSPTITLTGDVTGSGTPSIATAIANGAVTLAKMANVATATVFYRKTAGTGAPEVQTLATLKTDLGLTGTNSGDQTITLTGNVTGSGTGSFATTIPAGTVTLAMQANMATSSLVYRKTAGSGAPEVNTLATLKTDLLLTGTNSGDQTITLTGDVTGSGTGSFAATLAASGVTAATYGDATHVPQIAIDAKGRITTASNVAISGGGGASAFTGLSDCPASYAGAAGQAVFVNGGATGLVFGAPSTGSVSVVQYKSFVGDNPTLTLTSVPTPGNILVAVAGVWNGVSNSNSPWVQVINTAGVSNDGVYAAYRAVTAADVSATISKPANQTTSQGWNITIFEISGAAYSPPIFDSFKEVSATSKSLLLASMKANSCVVGCFNTNSGNPAVSSITGATAGTSVAGTSTGGSPRRANPFSSTGLAANAGLTVTVNYGSAPTAITGVGLVFSPV